jgi:S1-C subfamily serine protease
VTPAAAAIRRRATCSCRSTGCRRSSAISISTGRAASPGRPWLGLNTEELRGRLFVSRVTPGGPAEKAGIQRGDVIVGVNGEHPKSLADFYRKVWAQGSAGADVVLDVLQESQVRRIDVKSINRLDHLKLKSTF